MVAKKKVMLNIVFGYHLCYIFVYLLRYLKGKKKPLQYTLYELIKNSPLVIHKISVLWTHTRSKSIDNVHFEME